MIPPERLPGRQLDGQRADSVSTSRASCLPDDRLEVFTPDSGSLVAGAAGRVALLSLADDSGRAVSFAASSTRPDARLRIGTPDGGTMVTLDEAGTIREWTTEPGRLVEHACTVAGRNLTPGEWRAVLPGRGYSSTCPSTPRSDGRHG